MLKLYTWTRGFSMSHCTGRIVLPTPRSNGATGNVRLVNVALLAMLMRGVAGGFVTVTIRFCWLFVLKYSPYPERIAVRPVPNTSHATPMRGERFLYVGFWYSCP